MRSTWAPSSRMAWLYDGEVALRRAVTLAPGDDALIVGEDAGDTTEVPGDRLTFVEDRGAELVYGRTDRIGWRLIVPKPLPDDLAALLPPPSRYGSWIDKLGLWRAVAIGLAGSAAVMLLVWSLPHWLGPLVPDRWLKAYGEAAVGDFGGRFCGGAGGQQALDKLVRRIAPDARDLDVRVVNIKIVNAAALPGGDIVLFRELVSEARGPEELAGVLAHEVAHVRNRDVAEAMVRELGFGLVIGAIGGDFGSNVHRLAALSYSRTAEARADADAIRALRRAGISPAPTAGFFDRLAAQEAKLNFGDALVYLSTHPLSKGRAERYRRAALRRPAEPLLTRDEWDALADICHNPPA